MCNNVELRKYVYAKYMRQETYIKHILIGIKNSNIFNIFF